MQSLTPSQKSAIQKTQGPCVILAGAGTGKTFTIVEKIKYLIQNKVYQPEKIVCITFSNEACNSLQTRIQKFLNNSLPIIRTFHAFSADLMRKHGPLIGIQTNFTILTPDEAKVVLHSNLKVPAGNCHRYVGSISTAKDLGISLEELNNYLNKKLAKYQTSAARGNERAERANEARERGARQANVNELAYKQERASETALQLAPRSDLLNTTASPIAPHTEIDSMPQTVDLEKRLESLQFEFQTLYLKKDKDKFALALKIKELKDTIALQKFVKAWQAYEKLKKLKNYQDYSDLNKNALELLQRHPEISKDYDYLVVDEFQDTNKIQLDLLKCLSPNRNITIVGDINQSIYRFRGAYNQNLKEFKQYFNVTSSDSFNLDKSHRSSNKILKAAHQLILNNYCDEKECFEVKNAYNREGENIEAFELLDSKEEARKVAELVEEKIRNGKNPNDICIMFRNHQFGRIIKKSLEFKDIPYCSVSKSSLLTQRSIKTIINYLTILNKLKQRARGGEHAWWELIYHLNLKEKDLIKVGKFIKENRESENVSAKLLTDLPNLELDEESKIKIRILLERIKIMIPFLSKPLTEFLKHAFHCSGLVNGKKTKEEKEIILNLNKFYDLASAHAAIYEPDLPSFLHHLDILDELKIEVQAAEIEENGVRLMTLHSTKGLEYDTVIITNLAQKRFPMERFNSNSLIPLELSPEFKSLKKEDVEYVAYELEEKHQLFEERRLCYVAFTRAKNNLILTFAQKYGTRKFYPSQFLNEIRYQNNPNVSFFVDDKELYQEPEVKIKPALDFSSLLLKKDFEDSIKEAIKDHPQLNPETPKEITFSPSSLLLFSECQKKYEYKYVFNMPEERIQNWEAIRLGSFVHAVLEIGVKERFTSLNDFINYANSLHLKEDWETVVLEDALHLIKVFYERNKNKFNEKSRTEQYLSAEFDGIKFLGFADRIDFSPQGLEIIDYKTGATNVQPKNRNWQLGFYALAAERLGKVRKITLEMLKQEKPLEFEIDEKGNAHALHSNRMEFNINEVKDELVEEARKVLQAYKSGFKPCPIEKNCEFCNEYFYS
jgi:DNA helicase II / ATP-dependent DNA helicase PcrA